MFGVVYTCCLGYFKGRICVFMYVYPLQRVTHFHIIVYVHVYVYVSYAAWALLQSTNTENGQFYGGFEVYGQVATVWRQGPALPLFHMHTLHTGGHAQEHMLAAKPHPGKTSTLLF